MLPWEKVMTADLTRQKAPESPATTPTSLRFLVPMDFEPDTLAILNSVVQRAVAAPATVTLLTVVDLTSIGPSVGPVNAERLENQKIEDAKAKLALLQQTYAQKLELETAIRIGLANEAIRQFAEEEGCTTIFMVKHLHRWRQRLFSHHTVEQVLSRAKCQVEIIGLS